MSLKITTLIENMPGDKDDTDNLYYEHGLSLYIEFDGRKILFDTGQSQNYIDNAKSLGIDISAADMVVLSHGHYDHSTGVPSLIGKIGKEIPVYCGEGYFRPKYKKLEDGTWHYNGNPFTKEQLTDGGLNIKEISENVTFLTGNIVVFKNFPKTNDYELTNPKFFIKSGEEYEQDEFTDEIVLGLITPKGLIIIAGCSHAGIVNILSEIRKRLNIPVYSVLGGTHLVEADENRLNKTVEAFHQMGIHEIAVSHCTGEEGMKKLSEDARIKYIKNNTGNIYYI